MELASPLFERIDRVFVPVPDVGRAAAWFVTELEFRIAGNRGKEIDLRVHKGETQITLQENRLFKPRLHLHEEGHVPCFNFYTHWEDLHVDWLASRGINTTETMNTPYLNVCEMLDPDGNVLGICHEKASSLYHTPHAGPLPPMFHRVLAVFIPVKDLEASIGWYCSKLGFTVVHHWGEGADLRVGSGETIVTMIRMDEHVHRAALRSVDGEPYYSLETPDIRTAYQRLASCGAAVDECLERDGICRFDAVSPEGLKIRISEKQCVRVG